MRAIPWPIHLLLVLITGGAWLIILFVWFLVKK